MRVYISRQRARSFGPLCYRKAKNGYMMLVTHMGQTWWMGNTINHGFYLYPFNANKGQSEQLNDMVA